MDSLFEFTETIEAEVERTMVEEGQAARKGEVASREKERERESWGLSARPLSLPLLIGRDAFSFPRKTRPRRVTTPR